MKRLFILPLVLSAVFSFNTVFAQEAQHVAKLNLAAFSFRNVSLQYEKPFSDKMSAGLGLRFMIPRTIPAYVDATEDGSGSTGDSKMTGWSVTPEFRFYTGGEAPTGFYLAPYFRYTNFKLETEGSYVDDDGFTQYYPLTGKYNGFGGGIMIGNQWLINDKFSIDWWIIGVHYGTATASLEGETTTGAWTANEQQDIENELEATEVPFGTTEVDVDPNSAKFSWNMPFLGFRPGICLGWAF